MVAAQVRRTMPKKEIHRGRVLFWTRATLHGEGMMCNERAESAGSIISLLPPPSPPHRTWYDHLNILRIRASQHLRVFFPNSLPQIATERRIGT